MRFYAKNVGVCVIATITRKDSIAARIMSLAMNITVNAAMKRTKHMTTDKLIAELKLVSWADRKPGMGSMDAIYLDDAIQIIRNHQPEPTQKQVDEAKLRAKIATELSRCSDSTGNYDWNNYLHREYMINAVVLAIRPYHRQVDNVGEPQQVSGDEEHIDRTVAMGLRRLMGLLLRYERQAVLKDPYSCISLGQFEEIKGKIIALFAESPTGNTQAALQTPQPATVDNAELEKVRELLRQCAVNMGDSDVSWESFKKTKEALAILDKLLGKDGEV